MRCSSPGLRREQDRCHKGNPQRPGHSFATRAGSAEALERDGMQEADAQPPSSHAVRRLTRQAHSSHMRKAGAAVKVLAQGAGGIPIPQMNEQFTTGYE